MSENNNVTPGTYRAVAVPVDVDGFSSYVQFGTTKGSEGKQGTKQVVVQFEILDGQFQGRRVTWFGYFTEKTWERTVKSLRYCGYKGDDLAACVTQELDQEVSITVELNTWEGKTTSRVAWVNASGGGIKLANPMDQAGLRQFAAAMKSRVAQVPAVEGKKATKGEAAISPAADEPPPPTDDDMGIPF